MKKNDYEMLRVSTLNFDSTSASNQILLFQMGPVFSLFIFKLDTVNDASPIHKLPGEIKHQFIVVYGLFKDVLILLYFYSDLPLLNLLVDLDTT